MKPKPPPQVPAPVKVKRFAVAWGVGQNAINEFQSKANTLVDEGFEPSGGIAAAMFGTNPAIIQSFYKPALLPLSAYEPTPTDPAIPR